MNRIVAGLLVIAASACQGDGWTTENFPSDADACSDSQITGTPAVQVNEYFVFPEKTDRYSVTSLDGLPVAKADFENAIKNPSSSVPEKPTGYGEKHGALKFGVPFGVFYLFFRGLGPDSDTHPLKPCVEQPVHHVHVTIKKTKNSDDKFAWTHMHIGSYMNEFDERCYVAYDSHHKSFCHKLCVPKADPPDFDQTVVFVEGVLIDTLTYWEVHVEYTYISVAAVVIAVVLFGLAAAT